MKKLIICFIFIFLISFSSAALTDDLISYYKLDEISGTNAEDIHGANDATASNAAVFTSEASGVINTCADFTAAEYLIQKTSFAGAITGSSDSFSFNLWVYWESSAKHSVLIEIGNATNYFQLWRDKTSGKIAIRPINIFTNDLYTESSFAAPYDEWNMFSVTYNDSTNILIVYVNATIVLNVSRERDEASGTTLTIAGSVPGDYWIDGFVDEVAIASRAWTPDEITEFYNSSNGLAYPFSVDTCTCPGAGNNWEIDMADSCEITDNCDLTTGTLSFIVEGITKCDAEIKTTNLGDPGATGLLSILDDCRIYVNG